MFSGSMQHDAHEFLVFFLDYLNEDMNKVILKPYIQIKEYDGQEPVTNYADYCFGVHKLRNNSFVSEIFDGQTCILSECPDCLYKSIACEPFQVLSLSIPTPPLAQIDGFIHTISGDFAIQAFVCKFDVAADLGKVKDFVFRKFFQGNPEEFVPVFIVGNKIVERPVFPYRLSVSEIKEQESAFLFFNQIYDSVIMPLVFREKNKQIIDQIKGRIEYRVSIIVYMNEEQVSVEKEVVVPEITTANEVYLLVFAIFRENFIKSGIRDSERVSAVFPATRDLLWAEFSKLFDKPANWLFKLKGNEVDFGFGDKKGNLFDFFFENYMKLEVHLNANKFSSPVRLKNCYNSKSKVVEIADSRVTLAACFEWMIKTEHLDGDNRWFCKKCQCAKQAKKKLLLRKLPRVLVVHLNRFHAEFTENTNSIKKNNSLVDFPIYELNLTPYTLAAQTEQCYYNLFAVSNHHGSHQKGHYKSFCMDTLKKDWVCCDDTTVTKVDIRDLVTSNAYLLFYERVNR